MREQRQDLLRHNATNLDAFQPAALAGEDSNSGFRRFQKSGEIFDNRFVRTVFDGGSLDSYLECTIENTGNFIAAGARLNANLKNHGAVTSNDVELLAGGGT